jgi:hypothetical protein
MSQAHEIGEIKERQVFDLCIETNHNRTEKKTIERWIPIDVVVAINDSWWRMQSHF